MRNLIRNIQTAANTTAADIARVQDDPNEWIKRRDKMHWAILHIIESAKELEKRLRDNGNSK